MRILLIYALNIIAKERFLGRAEDSGYKESFIYPPLSIAHLGSVLEEKRFEVALRDDAVHTEDEILEAFAASDVVGISAMTPNAGRALHWAETAKKQGKRVVVGGAHATSCPGYFLESGWADFIVFGEGEETFPELLGQLEDEKRHNEIPGIGFIRNGAVTLTPERPLITDLDRLPFAGWHLLPMERYFEKQEGARTCYLFSSRGCPWNCKFCNKRMSTRRYRCRSSENVLEEIKKLIAGYDIDYVYFADDLFTGDRRRVGAICRGMIERGLRVRWSCVTRVNVVDPELLLLMRRAGCVKIEYGVESGSPRVLDLMNKRFTVDQIIRASRATRRAGILCKFFMMIGYPGETREDHRLTAAMLRQARPDRVGFMIFNPLPGCEIYEEVKDRVHVTDFSEYHPVFRGSIFEHETFSNDELKRIREELYADYMRFYHAPPQRLRRGWERLRRKLPV